MSQKQTIGKLKRGLFFNNLFAIAIEGMIEFLINGYLNAMTPEINLFGEAIGVSISWFCIIICSAALPLANFILAMTKDEK